MIRPPLMISPLLDPRILVGPTISPCGSLANAALEADRARVSAELQANALMCEATSQAEAIVADGERDGEPARPHEEVVAETIDRGLEASTPCDDDRAELFQIVLAHPDELEAEVGRGIQSAHVATNQPQGLSVEVTCHGLVEGE